MNQFQSVLFDLVEVDQNQTLEHNLQILNRSLESADKELYTSVKFASEGLFLGTHWL